MKKKNLISPDYLFEVSWEVCNKVGGIHTVIATKSIGMAEGINEEQIFIGPDVWMDTTQNPEFTEDPLLFRTWRVSAAQEGIRVRVGRWNVQGKPIAFLVDFSQYITRKNDILSEFWEKYKLDSLSGGWDYVESALFGYAAGRVIESFINFYLLPSQKVVAQFHEWMTGAGILYLKQTSLPVATAFTTHATTLGRSLAYNNIKLYDVIDVVDGDQKAKELNVAAKHSLEKCAAHNADVFTTVSDLTAKECSRFLSKDVDLVTPNGFEDSIVPESEEFEKYQKEGRAKLIEVAQAMTGEVFENPVLVGIGGRYEYKNKGIDIFVDSLAQLEKSSYSGRTILGFIMVPAGINGYDKELVAKLGGKECDYTTHTSHNLQYPENDPVLCRMGALGLNNRTNKNVKLLFVPSYLNGNDGVFNLPYYQLLSGLDLSVFPSYYEPWGYTPLESLAFKVPTVTTTLAGFGLWVNEYYTKDHPGISVIERGESNYSEVVDGVCEKIVEVSSLDKKGEKKYRDNAKSVSEIALWRNNLKFYKEAYSLAIERVIERKGKFPEKNNIKSMTYKKIDVGTPSWNRVLVTRNIPERLRYLDIISKNLWWCWNQEAMDLFKSIDKELWVALGRNPIALLDHLSYEQYQQLEKNEKFVRQLDKVAALFNEYMEAKNHREGASIAYFCMEYGLDASLKIYSGGLGILAGDYLKESSDLNVNMIGIGLLYRYGYFNQKLSGYGDQIADYEPQDFMKIPAVPVRDAEDKWVTISVAFPGRNIYARLWRVDVGRTELYLLDTDYDANLPEDRQVTYHLYGGDWENRLKQELLLGVGGIRAMRALGLDADVYHCNEGHAAFTGLERLREYINNDNLSYDEALEVVRASSLFTTHTPVPAGHDAFHEDLLRKYISHYPERLKIGWDTLMSLGKNNPYDQNEKFSMSNLACNISQEVNGVSWLHGKVSQDILASMWPGYLPEENHVGYVTNGVHYPTWTAPQWKEIHARVFGDEFKSHKYDKECFNGIYEVKDAEIMSVRQELRQRLIKAVKKQLSDPTVSSHYSPQHIVEIKRTLRDDVLTIGFARRFATYKRAHLLFRDLDRLSAIVNNPKRPVQFLFAGKAHPADKAGSDLIKKIVDISKMPQFIGKIVFVPNYDINIAKYLVQGVDVWMNNPTRPLEASGTSGEKAAMNGVMHFSVLDGWWVEGYKEGAGWALPQERTYDDQNFQDELDAATIYNIIESEIAPTYYDVNPVTGIPTEWIKIIKNCIAKVACDFTTNRMFNDYIDKYYKPLAARAGKLIASDYAEAREIALWKRKMRKGWEQLEIRESNFMNDAQGQLLLGKEFKSYVSVFVGDMDPNDIGFELVYARQNAKGRYVKEGVYTFDFEKIENGVATYSSTIVPNTTGAYQIAGRIFAKSDKLPHRQDFELVRWL